MSEPAPSNTHSWGLLEDITAHVPGLCAHTAKNQIISYVRSITRMVEGSVSDNK